MKHIQLHAIKVHQRHTKPNELELSSCQLKHCAIQPSVRITDWTASAPVVSAASSALPAYTTMLAHTPIMLMPVAYAPLLLMQLIGMQFCSCF